MEHSFITINVLIKIETETQVCMYAHVYTHTHVCTHISHMCVYIYSKRYTYTVRDIYSEWERERHIYIERERVEGE